MPGPSVNRTTIKNTLLGLIATATFSTSINGFSSWAQAPSRRLKLWNRVDPSAQPAAFLVQHRETYEIRGPGNIQRRWLDMGVWCYAPTADESVIGDDFLDLMESAIEDVLVPDDPTRGVLTLGGLVEWCRIDRTDNAFIRDPGDIDGQALLVLPVRILLP